MPAVTRRTIGISPKVYVPVIAQAVAGVVLIALGFDVEGKTLLATALATAGLGGGARPGQVTTSSH